MCLKKHFIHEKYKIVTFGYNFFKHFHILLISYADLGGPPYTEFTCGRLIMCIQGRQSIVNGGGGGTGGGHKLCVEIEIFTPSANTITSRGSLRSPLVRDVNPKLNEGNCSLSVQILTNRVAKCAIMVNLKCI